MTVKAMVSLRFKIVAAIMAMGFEMTVTTMVRFTVMVMPRRFEIETPAPVIHGGFYNIPGRIVIAVLSISPGMMGSKV
jgi:hypothetical protein